MKTAERENKSTDIHDIFSLLKNFRRINTLYAAELREFHIQYNFSRLIFFCVVAVLIGSVETMFSGMINQPAVYMNWFLIGFSLFVLALLIVKRRAEEWKFSIQAEGIVHISVVVFLIWGVLLMQISNAPFLQGFTVFIIIVIGVAAVFMLNPLYFFALSTLCLVLLISPLSALYAPDFSLSLPQIYMCTGALIIGWLISGLHYLSTIELFLVRDKMQQSESMAELALASGNLGYWNWDIESEKIYVDKRWSSMLGYSDEARVLSFADFFSMVIPQDRQKLASKIQSFLDGSEKTYTYHFRMQAKDGSWRWIYAQGRITMRGHKGKPLCMHGIHQDLQDIQDRQKQLTESEARFKAYTENSPVGVFIVKDFHFIYVNPEAIRITGYSREELKDLKLLSMVYPEDQHDLVKELKKIVQGQVLNSEYTYRIVGKAGNIHWIEVRATLLDRTDPTFLLSVIDITARKNAEDRLKEYATFDELTGVYNRRVGISLLEQEMHHTKRERSVFTVCFVDVNGLKLVNDTWGHDEGDALIKTVVGIIQGKLRRGDVLCRLGGDEFLMMFKNCSMENANRIWDRIQKKLEITNSLSEKPYTISVSYGLLEYGHSMEISVMELINMADQKMYDHKKTKRTNAIDHGQNI